MDILNMEPFSEEQSEPYAKTNIQELARVELYFNNEFLDLKRTDVMVKDISAEKKLMEYYKNMRAQAQD